MKTLKEIESAIAKQAAQVQAIVELATEEERELTADEQLLVDKIQGVGEEPGELDKLKAERDRVIRFEEKVKNIAGGIKFPSSSDPDAEKPAAKIVVPAKAKLHGKLRAFAGENGDRDAYTMGRWAAASLFGHRRSAAWLDDHGIRADMSESEDDRGGLFVPTEMQLAIVRLVEEFGIARQYARIEPMGSDTKRVPIRTEGLTATPVGETTRANSGSNTVAVDDIKYTIAELVARKWKVVVKISDELNEDSLISLAEQIAIEAATAFAYAEDNSAFNGDGTSTYHGISGVMNALLAGSVHTALSGNTAFSTLDLADFLAIKGKLPRYAGINPAWFISQEGYCDSMERLQMAAGGLTPADLANGGLPRFLGAPVVITNVLNGTLTAQTDTKLLAYGDLSMAALFGDRRVMTMATTEDRYWDEDQIGIKATERFDFVVHSKGTATAPGAMLVLQTPGS